MEAPKILILIIQILNEFILRHIGINRINPYPPSFKSTAARIIDPSKGASTWALGSHKCVMNMGIFIRKAINKIK